ncbi:DUF2063 domain-containing protein [Frigidibacter albus]|uniref:DUF2063 domain-containing protein n=1 Tax=Frigidibacter albus TaxID=1465486 RepID=A0A6L8VJW3_9RHOB|nr:putative DNA-binding domain-containing protein [Frigidibacter albus]MZQ89986.1 DUF2063 domain-containing protein [Frigidibacter albus]NBE31894.1 DUF2063 domain-containing protein [Frigidibacter albus]GGH57975.1 DUF2063 domain-containing protein [Frigidibacter albus]
MLAPAEGHGGFVAAFRAGLVGGGLPEGVTAVAEAEQRFAVYRNNVAHSLTEALARRFPAVSRLVGDAFFRAMARVFIAQHPPASPVLLDWGAEFPGFLKGFPPVAGLPYLPDVARIERARGLAYHAADAVAVSPAALAGATSPEALRLVLHPSVALVASAWPAASIWAANQPGADAAGMRAQGPELALILRDRALEVPVRALAPGDAALVAALLAGQALGPAALRGQLAEPGHDPAAVLGYLMAAGAIIEVGEAA